jgi:hypothetical protein
VVVGRSESGRTPFGTVYIPKEAAEVVKSALKAMLKAGDISPANRWQVLEYWAAECVAK